MRNSRKCVSILGTFCSRVGFPKVSTSRSLLFFFRVTIGTEKSQVALRLPVPIHFRWLQRRRRQRAGKRDILSISLEQGSNWVNQSSMAFMHKRDAEHEYCQS